MLSKQSNVINCDKDYFIERDGIRYAGTHLLVDLWGATKLDDIKFIEATLIECINNCNATLLHIHLHHFSSSGGISGVAVLAESHISVHTWPERDYAAFDIFMCGDASPENALPVLKRAFMPERFEVKEMLRGKAEE
jgi:S-adenosylmethionine decarboxylase